MRFVRHWTRTAIFREATSNVMSEDGMDIEPSRPVVIAPARYVLLPLANELTGYTVKAIQCKIHRGEWQEGKVWRRAPDGRILIDIAGYERWVESR
jgi:hypothetical protein